MRTLREDGTQKVLAGMTTVAEVLMITTQDME
jgi:type II secretory ATPase GspE/PulE/Tfp pilus assembly ATPase PilB-like protein